MNKTFNDGKYNQIYFIKKINYIYIYKIKFEVMFFQ